jgi:hypothetical protein
MRNPLQKENFLQGTRQKWFSVLLLFSAMILLIDARSDIDAAAYLNFLTITGSIFILGASADSMMKIKAAEKTQTTDPQNEEPGQ